MEVRSPFLPSFLPSFLERKRNRCVFVEREFRSQLIADPNPPPPQRAYGAPSMPGIVEPIVGYGDSAVNAKEAEKLAALEACVRLSARGLFTSVSFLFSLTSGGFRENESKERSESETELSFPFLSLSFAIFFSLIYQLERKVNIHLYIPLPNPFLPLTRNPQHSTPPRLLLTVNLQPLFQPIQLNSNRTVQQQEWYLLVAGMMGNGLL